jgi:DegV family protein with EDD domain
VSSTASTTAIVLDSTSDLPGVERRFPNMRDVPLYVRFGTESLRDHVDISPAEFYERLTTATELPTTSQPTPHDFLSAFKELRALGYQRIWCLTVSAKLSGTYGSAVTAAEELGDGSVRVVDTRSASLANAQLAFAIQRRLERGTSDAEIEDLIARYTRDHGVIFTLQTLEYLQRGGRIGKAQALAGSLLNVKPILSIEDGEIVPRARVRGRQKALEEFARVFIGATQDRPGLRVAIAHANAPEWIEVLRDLVVRARPAAEIELIEVLGAVVGTHSGPGAVGFFWFHDDP